jgi:hypothetical protein
MPESLITRLIAVGIDIGGSGIKGGAWSERLNAYLARLKGRLLSPDLSPAGAIAWSETKNPALGPGSSSSRQEREESAARDRKMRRFGRTRCIRDHGPEESMERRWQSASGLSRRPHEAPMARSDARPVTRRAASRKIETGAR